MKGGRLRRVRTKASKGEDEGGFEGFEGGQGFEGKGDNWNVTEHATGGGLRPPQPPRSCQAANPPSSNPTKPIPGQLACQACPHKKEKATRKRSWWLKNGEK